MSGHSGAYAMQFVAVDVGTQSVRAALVTEKGKIVKTATCPLDTWNPQPDFYQQSSEQVWRSCCTAVKVRGAYVLFSRRLRDHGVQFVSCFVFYVAYNFLGQKSRTSTQ